MSTDVPSRDLLQRAAGGDSPAMDEIFKTHRARLRHMVQLRLDRRLQGRIDPSDVLQEAYMDVWNGLSEYLEEPYLPFYLWLRLITSRKLHALHRRHLGVDARDARREISIQDQSGPCASSESLVAQLLGDLTSPSEGVLRNELQQRLHSTLNSMKDVDREVLILRHFEQLTNAETAKVLGIHSSAASNRYVRALERLREVLEDLPGLF